MHAQISAKGEDATTSAKTMRVWAEAESLKFSVFVASGELRIHAECTDHYGSGMRGGDVRRIDRDFWLTLDKSEIELVVSRLVREKVLNDLQLRHLDLTSVKIELEATRNELDATRRKLEALASRVARARRALG